MNSRLGYTVLVDGYNVIKRHPAWADLSLPQGRASILEHLRQVRWPFPVSKLIIVFDAQEDRLARVDSAAHAIEIRYAVPTADFVIQETIRQSRHPEWLVCISDDRAILHTAKSHQAKFYPGRWLFTRQSAQHAPFSRKQGNSAEKLLPAAQARMITEELARRWLG